MASVLALASRNQPVASSVHLLLVIWTVSRTVNISKTPRPTSILLVLQQNTNTNIIIDNSNDNNNHHNNNSNDHESVQYCIVPDQVLDPVLGKPLSRRDRARVRLRSPPTRER